MAKKTASRMTTVSQVYLIIALFVALIFILILLIQIQMNALMAVRAYVGAEGLWAKAQKDATRSIEHYAISRNEDDYQAYLRFIQVPLGDLKSRLEMQKPNPNLDVAREGFLNGGNHPEDIEYMINLFVHFQNVSFMAEAIRHWTAADQFIEELNGEAEQLHKSITSGHDKPETARALLIRLDTINQHLTEQEGLFSATLANASRWASDVSRNLAYALAFLFTLLGIGISRLIITRIRAIENALLKSEEDLRISATAFESHESMMITDANSVILRVNQAFIDETGYASDEVVGKTPRLLKSGRHDEEFYRAMWETLLLTGTWEGEIYDRRKNGEVYPKWLTISAVKRSDGVVTHYVGSNIDITERKEAEHALNSTVKKLRESQQLLEAIVEHIPVMVFVKRASDLHFELFNRAGEELLGYSRSDLLGKGNYDLWPKEQGDWFTAADRKVLASKEIVEIPEEPIRAANGETRYLHTWKVALCDAGGEPTNLLGISIDITKQKAAEKEMRIASTAFETHEAIMITDADANIIRVNQAFQDITGFSAEDVLGKNPRILSSGRQDQEFYAAMWQQLLNSGTWTGEIWDKRKNGQIYPKWLTITAVKDNAGKTTEYVAIFSDITARKQAEEEIYSLAYYDLLTKLPNRRLLLDRIRQAQSISARSKHYGALLFLDMDRFKTLNDTLGHDHGDLFLIEIAKRMQRCVREVDTVARIGGDEFVVLIEEIGSNAEEVSQKVALIAEKIRASLSSPYQLKEHEHHSSPSIGVSLYRGNDEALETLLKQADMAMYQAKESGRNAVRFFDPAMQIAVEIHAALEADLRHAVPDRQLRLFYQIQLDSDLRPLGAEALIRWFHPVRGMVSPAQFIPIAEESSLILDIGHWVLETACKQLALWGKREQTNNLTLAINVSAQQFKRHDFVDMITTLVNIHQIDPSHLKLELTESVVLSDVSNVITKMHALKAMGISLSLDDFGTGYSSLSYLKQLPLDQIKIDQSFVRDITTDSSDAVMVQTIINLAKNFRLNVIAEGVETEAQLSFLKQNGCMAYQGYLFSKPVPIGEFEELLKNS